MGQRYDQLTLEEREQIAVFKAMGKSLREMASLMGRHPSTLSRELNRNTCRAFGFEGYGPARAELWARRRKEAAGKRPRLKDEQIRSYVAQKLKLGWSPEQISGRLKIENSTLGISHEAIYQYVYAEAKDLIPYLSRRHKRRRVKIKGRHLQRMPIPHRIGIDERPEEVNQRQTFGHWEADSAVSRASQVSLHVLLERKSRLVKITKLRRNASPWVQMAVTRKLKHLPRRARLTITYDNGLENCGHLQINQELKTQSYFCHPYHSWEKGAVENSVGLVRRFLPKKTNFERIPSSDISQIENLINNRPRKCLNYQTPKEVFKTLSGAIAG